MVQLNTKYLIASKAVPNYDQAPGVSEALLASYVSGGSVEPMGIGLATAYMPTTGAHPDIGILPQWAAAYVLTMDARARNATLASGDGAGSFPIHYRDRATDRPVALADHPRMTILGRTTDAAADAFPGCVADCTTPYTPDTSHQPSFAYLPYLLTGDYFYLEEMQFWGMYDAFNDNPNYRGFEKGLVIPGQLRAQAWSLRTIAQAAYLTPDADPLKDDFVGFVSNNLDWYNANYPNNPSFGPMKYADGVNNNLGVMTHTYSVAYAADTAVSTWMDDFFTAAVGYTYDLGFLKAKPMLDWKAKFPVGRMTAPGVCWISGAPYSLTIRDTSASTVYETFAQAYAKTFGADFLALPCASSEMAVAWGKKIGGTPAVGDMGNISNGTAGYPANMQPALAYAVDSGIAGAAKAWALYQGRTVKQDFSTGPQFSIVPRALATVPVVTPPAPVPPVVVQPAPPTIGKVTTGANVKLVNQAPMIVVFINTANFSIVKTFTKVTPTAKGAFTVSDPLLVPGTQYIVVVGTVGKLLDSFLVTVPK